MIRNRLRSLRTASATPRRLAWFRIGLCSVLLVQALGMVGHLDDLYGRDGIVAWSVNSADLPPGVPNLVWLDQALRSVSVPAGFVIPLVFAIYVGCLSALLFGYRTRLAAAVAWLTHTALLTSSDMTMYGVDRFAQIGLFYCLWFPVGHALSVDAVKKPGFSKKPGFCPARPSFQAWLGLRVLQLHVCIAYTASGVEKALGEQWWNGEAIWLVGIVGLHLGIAVVMNLWTFSAVMIVFDIAAFGIPVYQNALVPAGAESLSAHKRGIRPRRSRLQRFFEPQHTDVARPAHS